MNADAALRVETDLHRREGANVSGRVFISMEQDLMLSDSRRRSSCGDT